MNAGFYAYEKNRIVGLLTATHAIAGTKIPGGDKNMIYHDHEVGHADITIAVQVGGVVGNNKIILIVTIGTVTSGISKTEMLQHDD